MSRIGKQAIILPEKVSARLEAGVVTISGPLGTLSRPWDERLTLELGEKNLAVTPKELNLDTRALWGTYAAHLRNMIRGVTAGFQKQLLIEGVGYKAALAGDKLVLALGFSHPVEMAIPAGLKVVSDKTGLTISGSDKEAVGLFAARVRAERPPEPYRGKGIRYSDEVVRRKQGKKVTAAA